MSAPSLPLTLFTVADAFTRGGMPEPVEVRVNDERSLTLMFEADEAAARRWAQAMGIDPDDPYSTWRTQPYTGQVAETAGRQFTLINAYGMWQGIRVRITALVPVEEPAAVTS